MSESMRVIGLSAENFKRLRAVELRPRPGLNVIGGRNAQGKSSILDSIEAGLGGAKSCPSQPIRQGANRAEVVLDLGDIRVTRTWTGNGSRLTVTDAGGVVIEDGRVAAESEAEPESPVALIEN